MNKLALDGASTPPSKQGGLQLGDLNSFPSLRPGTPDHLSGFAGSNSFPGVGITPPPGLKHFRELPVLVPDLVLAVGISPGSLISRHLLWMTMMHFLR
ncbi:hypothetical protein SNK04_008218 [Fusarium graminearum]